MVDSLEQENGYMKMRRSEAKNRFFGNFWTTESDRGSNPRGEGTWATIRKIGTGDKRRVGSVSHWDIHLMPPTSSTAGK